MKRTVRVILGLLLIVIAVFAYIGIAMIIDSSNKSFNQEMAKFGYTPVTYWETAWGMLQGVFRDWRSAGIFLLINLTLLGMAYAGYNLVVDAPEERD